MKNEIINRFFFRICIELASPVSISTGETSVSDHDVARNHDGLPFIPGTSLAGAFRNHLEQKKDDPGAFGYSCGDNGEMSPISISDLYFDTIPVISIRDQVSLNDDKSVNNKFDTQIIESGAEGVFYMEVCQRSRNSGEDYEYIIATLLKGMDDGIIRFGHKKNRGYGRMKILSAGVKKFTKDSVAEYLSFLDDVKDAAAYDEFEFSEKADCPDKMARITAKLNLTGGISIRKYSAASGKADYEHITDNGKPVIPGTSWNGAIRSDVKRIMDQLEIPNKEELMNTWFGTASGNQSMFVVSESFIEGGTSMPVTRNSINRFSAATSEGALYTEQPHFGGQTTLEILIRKCSGFKALMGILLLAVSDIQNGFVSIGGQGAIGRGIFSACEGAEQTAIENGPTIEECMTALYEICGEVKA